MVSCGRRSKAISRCPRRCAARCWGRNIRVLKAHFFLLKAWLPKGHRKKGRLIRRTGAANKVSGKNLSAVRWGLLCGAPPRPACSKHLKTGLKACVISPNLHSLELLFFGHYAAHPFPLP